MAFTFFNNREPRQFNYKPRYYDPKKEESTGDARKDFARKASATTLARKRTTPR